MADLTTNINYMMPTGFRVTFSHPDYDNIEYFAQSVAHPSVDVSNAEVSFSRINLPVAGDKMTHSPLSMTFLMDEDMETFKEIHDWLNRLICSPQVSAADALAAEGKFPTECDIAVTILTSHNNKNQTIVYHHAFPIALGAVDFNSTQNSGDYLTFDAQFKFSYFSIK